MHEDIENNCNSSSQKKAKAIIRAEMIRRGMTFDELAERVNPLGHTYSGKSLNAKVNRGTFSAAFFLELLEVIGVRLIELDIEA